MYNIFNLLCVELLCVMCYMKPLCCICVKSYPSNQIMYVYNYFCYFMHMFVVNQRLMVLHMSFFLFHGYSRYCHIIDLSCTKVKLIMLRKIPKNLYFTVFFNHLRVSRFISFRTSLSVIPPVSIFSTSKFKFRPIFNRFY
jgi:hypothetical protein